MTRFLTAACAAAFALLLPLAVAAAPLVAKVDISSQTMTVIYNGQITYQWPVSTARPGKYTPRGSWTAK